jgi:hypothetical protein
MSRGGAKGPLHRAGPVAHWFWKLVIHGCEREGGDIHTVVNIEPVDSRLTLYFSHTFDGSVRIDEVNHSLEPFIPLLKSAICCLHDVSSLPRTVRYLAMEARSSSWQWEALGAFLVPGANFVRAAW